MLLSGAPFPQAPALSQVSCLSSAFLHGMQRYRISCAALAHDSQTLQMKNAKAAAISTPTIYQITLTKVKI